MEWSENVADALERETVLVSICRGGRETQRVVTIEGVEL